MKISKYPTQILLTALFSIVLASCSSGGSDSKDETPPPIEPEPEPTFPSLEVSPSAESYDFGTIVLNEIATPYEVTITNSSTATARLDVSSILLTGDSSFSLDENAGTTPCATISPALEIGKSCTVEVTFNPTQPPQVDPLTATLTIDSNDANNTPVILALSGNSKRDVTALNVTTNQVEIVSCPQATAFVSVIDQSAFPVKGLTSSDFSILEGTSTATVSSVDTVANAAEPMFLSILMDYSDSMDSNAIAAIEAEAIKMIGNLKSTDLAEIIKFNSNTYKFKGSTFVVDNPGSGGTYFNSFTSDKLKLEAAINKSISGTGAAIYHALELGINDVKQAAIDAGSPGFQRKVVVLITIGADTSTKYSLNSVTRNAKDNDIPVYVVGIAGGSASPELQQLTVDTNAILYRTDGSQDLTTIFQQQLAALLFTDQYVVKYDSTSSGGGKLSLEMTASKTGIADDVYLRQSASCP